MTFMSLDQEVKYWLRKRWPTKATQLWRQLGAVDSDIRWIRAQPIYDHEKRTQKTSPRLVAAGSTSFFIQPDGLWFTLGIPEDDEAAVATFVDCVVIEACKSRGNFLQKRGLYAARTSSLEIDLRKSWLDGGVPGVVRCRRDYLGGQLPDKDFRLPVRHLRVLYVLPNEHDNALYDAVKSGVVLHAHEYACRVNRVAGYPGQQMQAFLKSMAPSQQFLDIAPYDRSSN